MALVKVKIMGKTEVTEHSIETIGELKASLGLESYAASVEGGPQDNSFRPQDGDLVTFAESVKGGKK